MKRFAIMGKTPSKANERIIFNDKIPLADSIFASWVPALINTMVPGSIPTWDDFARASSVVTGAMLLAGIGMAALIKMLPNTNRMQAVFLGASEDREAGYIAAPERKELIGHVGVAVTDLRPSGTATIGDERVDVVTQGEFITKGTEVRVIESEAYRHIVEAADDVA